MSSVEIFAKRLIKLREERGISQQELADVLGITRQSLSLYEKSERTINIELLGKIATHLKVTTDYLLGLTNTQTIDADERAVCDYTGLSDASLHNIIRIKELNVPKLVDTLNILLGNKDFTSFIQELNTFLHPDIYDEVYKEEQEKVCGGPVEIYKDEYGIDTAAPMREYERMTRLAWKRQAFLDFKDVSSDNRNIDEYMFACFELISSAFFEKLDKNTTKRRKE